MLLLDPFRAPKPLPILNSSKFVPKRVSSSEGVDPKSSEFSFLFFFFFCGLRTSATGFVHRVPSTYFIYSPNHLFTASKGVEILEPSSELQCSLPPKNRRVFFFFHSCCCEHFFLFVAVYVHQPMHWDLLIEYSYVRSAFTPILQE